MKESTIKNTIKEKENFMEEYVTGTHYDSAIIDDKKDKIKELRAKGMTYRQIGEILGFSYQYAQWVCLGRSKTLKKHKYY